jgi:hypothetical protein
MDVRASRRMVALAALAVGVLAGCGGAHSAGTVAAPAAPPPSIDDSSATIETPPPVFDANVPDRAGTTASAGPTAPGGGTGTTGPADSGGTDAGSAGARTVPGIADGATALPPAATVPDASRCRTSALRLEPLDLQGSPGGTYANYRLLNVSGKPCAVRGYVGARLIGDNGRDLATTVRHEAGPDVWVRIANRGAAQFHLRFPNPMSGPTPCNPPNAANVRVSLPGTTGTLGAPTPEGGVPACNGELSTAPIGST